ncbi:hypothetical protein EON65_08690 [archaeon]|nr:MAG: hypothetical protein EON65_08690 [archaeon]
MSQSGYGFVSFDSPQACQAAHAKLKGLIINGITYDCSMAKRTFSVSRPHAMLVSEQGSFRHAGTNDHAGGPYAPDHHQQVNNMQSHEHHQHHQYAHLAPHGYASSASLQQVNQHAPSPYGAPLDTCTQYQHPHPSASQYMIPPQQTPSYYVLAQHLPAQPQFAVRQLPGYAPQYMAPGGPAYVLNDTQQHHLQPAHQPAFHPASQQVFLNPGSLPHARTDQHQNQHQQHLYQQQQQQQQYHYEQLQLQLQHYKQQQHQQHQHHQQQQKQQAQYHYEQQQLQLQHQHAMQTLADSHQFQSPPLQQSYRGQCNDQSKVRLRQDNCRHSLGASTNSPSSTSSKKNPLHK